MIARNLIFDLDGTLTDSRQGIFNSLIYSLTEMGYNDIPDSLPKGFIGPPLQKGFQHVFNFNENETKHAVRLYREYYAEKGWKENVPYSGIEELLNELSNLNYNIFVATAKLEEYSKQIIKYFGLDIYINELYGAGYEEKTAGKTHIINRAVSNNKLKKSETAVIGDTHFDVNGAKELELISVAVGYGFSEKNDLIELKPDYFVEQVDDLFSLLIE